MKGWERKQVLGAGGGRRGLGTARLGAGHTLTTHPGGAHTGVYTHTHAHTTRFASAPKRNSDETILFDVTECGAWITFIPQPQGSRRF